MTVSSYGGEVIAPQQTLYHAENIEMLVTFIFNYRPLGMYGSSIIKTFDLLFDQKCFKPMELHHEILSHPTPKAALPNLVKNTYGNENHLK